MDKFNLLEVTKPIRYVGLEFNAYRKKWSQVDVRWVLAFPDVYEVGFSHLGLKILYHILNSQEEVLADRVYTPWPDMEEKLVASGEFLRGIETGYPLKDFDFVGFSLQYELSYSNVLTTLQLGGIPVWSKDRQEEDPWVAGGGPCVFNSEPVADFFDFLVIGEGEEVVLEITKVFREWKSSKKRKRIEFLEEIRKIPGVYIPSFFSVSFKPDGEIAEIKPLYEDYKQVTKRVIQDLDTQSPLFESELVPTCGVVHDRLTVEIARGCTRGCRFCQAGFIYRPVRERRPEEVFCKILKILENTGYEEVGLLSLSAGDYCAISSLVDSLIKAFYDKKVSLSLPSLRVGTLSSEIMKSIREIRKTGFTLAPEAGTERLRKAINKDISTEELLKTSEEAFKLGWKLIKLYFMIGLPFEEDSDVDGIVCLCEELWKMGKPYRGGLHVGVSTFVPKPHTPFQWFGQRERDYIKDKISFLMERFKKLKGVELKWHEPAQSFWEAVLARGDRRLSKVIWRAWKMGARMDGWTELFKENVWLKASLAEGLDPYFFAQRTINSLEILPWEHISCGVSRDFLEEEKNKALSYEFTEDCRFRGCSSCGVCDFEHIKPLLYDKTPAIEVSKFVVKAEKEKGVFWYRFVYQKLGRARYISQTDLQRLFERSLRRAKLPLVFSQGFHPHPRISFVQALPVGMESYFEEGWVALQEKLFPGEIIERWNRELPEGLKIIYVGLEDKKEVGSKERLVKYVVEGLEEDNIRKLEEAWLRRITFELRKKDKIFPAEKIWLDFSKIGLSSVELLFLESDGCFFRPSDLMASLGFSDDFTRKLKIAKVGYVVLGEDKICLQN